jgi:hypothetical protein
MTETAEKLIEALHAELDKIHQRLDEVTKLCTKEAAPKPEPAVYALPAAEITLQPGEHYAGLVLDDTTGKPSHHLVLLAGDAKGLTWEEANAWAVEHGGYLPTRQEQALLFASLKREFEGAWYWSGNSSSGSTAWVQYFADGTQYGNSISNGLRVRAVRRIGVNVPQELQ